MDERSEWLEFIKEARELGLTPEDVREYLSQFNKEKTSIEQKDKGE